MCAWAAGTYTKGNASTGGWTGDASLGIGIEAGRHDTQDNDFATGINQCINKDGSNAFTGNPNLGGFIPTNIAAGTAAAPALCVGGDVNTGVFGPAADTWAVATNGTERVRVDSAGKVGIGVAPTEYISVLAPTSGAAAISVRGNNNSAANELYIGQDSGNVYFYNRNNQPILFGTNNTERMRITSGGGVGIGTSSVNGNLDVRTPYNDEDFVVGKVITGNYYLASKLVARHTTGSAANVFVDTGNNVLARSTSSAKYKTDIVDYTRGLNAVATLRPVFYKGINDGEKQFAGLIAEEVHEAGLSEFVVYDADNEPDALHYGNMVALAFKAIQELNAKVDALEARVAELEA